MLVSPQLLPVGGARVQNDITEVRVAVELRLFGLPNYAPWTNVPRSPLYELELVDTEFLPAHCPCTIFPHCLCCLGRGNSRTLRSESNTTFCLTCKAMTC